MNTYLLLRNNKKSDPYSLQQLLDLGLKPYDLIWVEGKSAAWLYPGEVDSLKEYATATEEQPYDRFYKKPMEEKSITQPVNNQKETDTPPIKNKKTLTTKSVFVSLPENFPAQKKTQSVQSKTPVPTEENPEERKTISLKEEPFLHKKYAESLDDIKKRYTDTYLKRKKKTKLASMYTSALQVFGGAIFFCLLVVAAYKIFSNEDKPVRSQRIMKIQPQKNNLTTGSNTTADIVFTKPLTDSRTQNQKIKTPVREVETYNKTQVSPAQKDNLTPKKASADKSVSEPGNERVKPRLHIENISNLVNVKANKYKQRVFGGVLNLELTVHNESKFALEKVVVDVQYLKPGEQILKTEKIVFNLISPDGTQTMKIPDYSRGIKVVYRITEIQSTQYDRFTAGL